MGRKRVADIFLLVCGILVSCAAFYLFNTGQQAAPIITTSVEEVEVVTPQTRYGYDMSQHWFEDYKIKYGAFLGDVLMGYGVNFEKIIELEKKANGVFSLKKIMAGRDITFVREDSCANPTKFIYAPDRFNYVIFDFGDNINVEKKEVEYTSCVETATGVLNETLYHSMLAQGMSLDLIDKMEDALGQVNFFTCQKGDQYRLIFEQKYIDGEAVATGEILAASYKSNSNEYFGFYYENDRYKGYYDITGTPTKKTFLRAPVRASRISSPFNLRRFHPILKRTKAHLGTDYAAPTGTEIFAVADGVITQRGYTGGNGNYVKIRHDKTYETQYLHMSRFNSKLRVGSRVGQGQVIGYVGSTGLATGPHVCYRFWKNGRQVNHMRENFPPRDPLPKDEVVLFKESRDLSLDYLQSIPYVTPTVAFAQLNNP